MRRREFIAGLGGAVAWPLAVLAQQRALPVVGYLGLGVLSDAAVSGYLTALRLGLAETGYVDRQNYIMEYFFAEYHFDRLPSLAAELVRRRPAVIIASSTASTLAAKAATETIPVVFQVGTDPGDLGIVASFGRRSSNLTGVALLYNAVDGKRLELLHELVPTTNLFAFLANPASPVTASETEEIQTAAAKLGVRVSVLNAKLPDDFGSAFASLARQGVGGLLVSHDGLFSNHVDEIVALAARHGVPAIYALPSYSRAGGLMSYGTEPTYAFHLMGTYVGRILKGEKPADLPVQQPTQIELVINLKTAKALGLTFPTALLVRADEVIE
jgi:putative tryptophan/tyrosine transport system substrate-binding protein